MHDALNTDADISAVEVPCPLCGAGQKTLLGTFHFQKRLLGLKECEECRLVFVCPRLTEHAMDSYFQTYTDVSSTEIIDWWRTKKKPNISRDLNLLKRLLPGGGRILDVGSGYGFFLEQAQAMGYETVGIEVSARACEYANKKLGLDVRLGRIKELNLAPQIFDAAVLFDVLDYLSDPLNELLQIRRLLKKGGFLMVRVLNRIHYALLWRRIVGSFNENIRGSFSGNPFFEKDHLIHFNQSTLKLILTKAGIRA
jgi:SAM-dependent methyltransferase